MVSFFYIYLHACEYKYIILLNNNVCWSLQWKATPGLWLVPPGSSCNLKQHAFYLTLGSNSWECCLWHPLCQVEQLHLSWWLCSAPFLILPSSQHNHLVISNNNVCFWWGHDEIYCPIFMLTLKLSIYTIVNLILFSLPLERLDISFFLLLKTTKIIAREIQNSHRKCWIVVCSRYVEPKGTVGWVSWVFFLPVYFRVGTREVRNPETTFCTDKKRRLLLSKI